MLNMKLTTRVVCAPLYAGLLLALFAPSLRAQADSSADAVTITNSNVYVLRGEQSEVLTENLKFPLDVEVTTNGTFTVANGQERKLGEGQVLRRDGWLLDADGSAWPVFDYVAMKEGKVVVVRDGQAETVTESMTLSNKLTISPDGSCVYPNGGRSRLVDGQLYRLDGSLIPAKDTITFKSGQVLVHKSGKLISLKPSQIMGMNDGTKVQWNGTLIKPDGTTMQLGEGQTVFVDGPAAAH